MTITELCKKVGMSRQNYYKARSQRRGKVVDEDLIKAFVQAERALQPRLGGRKLLKILTPKLKELDVSMGRDRFFKVLKNHGLLVEKLPPAPRTTNSYHNLPVFLNKVKDMDLTAPNQVWASDITYLRKHKEFLYLSLITDMYSRKIVGYHLGEGLGAAESVKALKMALKGKTMDSRPIHHSDRGAQYCSHLYIKELEKHGMVVSMTEQDHCSENSLAERVNGILKQEYGLRYEFKNTLDAHEAVTEAVKLYNTKRPHYSLGLEIPEHVHRMTTASPEMEKRAQ